MLNLYTENQYKKYSDYCDSIANSDILTDGVIEYLNLLDWMEKENLSQIAIDQMDQRMGKECEEEMKQEKRSHLKLVKQNGDFVE